VLVHSSVGLSRFNSFILFAPRSSHFTQRRSSLLTRLRRALAPSRPRPLQAWLHRSGFARFSNSRYSSDPKDIANNFMHLTNVAIQKTAENYDARSGGKWDIRNLKLYLVR
jgi:hypothetical protein